MYPLYQTSPNEGIGPYSSTHLRHKTVLIFGNEIIFLMSPFFLFLSQLICSPTYLIFNLHMKFATFWNCSKFSNVCLLKWKAKDNRLYNKIKREWCFEVQLVFIPIKTTVGCETKIESVHEKKLQPQVFLPQG